MKRKVLVGLAISVLLLALSVLLLMIFVGEAKAEDDYLVYLPIIHKAPPTGSVTPTATPTATATEVPPTATATPVPGPVPGGNAVKFFGTGCDRLFEDAKLEGIVTSSEYRTSLYHPFWGRSYPRGVFVVLLMDITNHGPCVDEAGFTSFYLFNPNTFEDFYFTGLQEQWAAEDEYGRDGLFDAIPLGSAQPMVFVFDVPPTESILYLGSLSIWTEDHHD